MQGGRKSIFKLQFTTVRTEEIQPPRKLLIFTASGGFFINYIFYDNHTWFWKHFIPERKIWAFAKWRNGILAIWSLCGSTVFKPIGILESLLNGSFTRRLSIAFHCILPSCDLWPCCMCSNNVLPQSQIAGVQHTVHLSRKTPNATPYSELPYCLYSWQEKNSWCYKRDEDKSLWGKGEGTGGIWLTERMHDLRIIPKSTKIFFPNGNNHIGKFMIYAPYPQKNDKGIDI